MTQQNRRPLRSRETAWAEWLARALVRWHIHPNSISIASLGAAGASAWCFWRAWYPLAAVFILLRLLCNLMDGMVAIEGGLGTPAGEIYNDLPDRISDALILCAVGYSLPWPSYARELGWIAAFLAFLTAYIRILGGALGLKQDFRGPLAKPQRMAVIIAASFVAPFDTRVLALALVLVAAGSLLTAILRLRSIFRQLADRR